VLKSDTALFQGISLLQKRKEAGSHLFIGLVPYFNIPVLQQVAGLVCACCRLQIIGQ
jgi:hypothetical protein